MVYRLQALLNTSEVTCSSSVSADSDYTTVQGDFISNMQTCSTAMRMRCGGIYHQPAAYVVGGGPQAVRSNCGCQGRVNDVPRQNCEALSQVQQRRLSGTSTIRLTCPFVTPVRVHYHHVADMLFAGLKLSLHNGPLYFSSSRNSAPTDGEQMLSWPQLGVSDHLDLHRLLLFA